jgi:uncharacterized protein YcaQ
VVEWLFATGRLVTASRRGFERLYDLPERVIPSEVLASAVPPKDEAQARLLVESAAALGVATLHDLADYFRLKVPTARPLVARLVEEGRLQRVRVEGWTQEAYVLPEAARPTRAFRGSALISPFDSLVFHRDRTERLFGFHYRIGIYTPRADRVHGYYVLPFLLGDRFVARVDLKADRQAGRLLVPAAHLERGAPARDVVRALADELRSMAQWLDLGRVVVGRRGDLCRPLRAALG